ncbi:MAG: DUF1476 domain-containing protein [Rhodospirillales bacterium]|nr:DUF1476 domain-containing protein [Rhodospirillales bacterium]
MNDTLREREKAFEADYKLQEELKFKAESRRNKLLGLWAAERMGMSEKLAQSYAKEVVLSDLLEPGTEDLVGKLLEDFDKFKVNMKRDEIVAEMERLQAIALDQVTNEYPDPLGNDHEKVGD